MKFSFVGWALSTDPLDLDISYRIHYKHQQFTDVKTISQSDPAYILQVLYFALDYLNLYFSIHIHKKTALFSGLGTLYSIWNLGGSHSQWFLQSCFWSCKIQFNLVWSNLIQFDLFLYNMTLFYQFCFVRSMHELISKNPVHPQLLMWLVMILVNFMLHGLDLISIINPWITTRYFINLLLMECLTKLL